MRASVLSLKWQPTVKLHSGNYLGALRTGWGVQRDYEWLSIFGIVESACDHGPSRTEGAGTRSILESPALYLAAGITPNQSTVIGTVGGPAHAEIAGMLTASTPIRWLERMTQFNANRLPPGSRSSMVAAIFLV